MVSSLIRLSRISAVQLTTSGPPRRLLSTRSAGLLKGLGLDERGGRNEGLICGPQSTAGEGDITLTSREAATGDTLGKISSATPEQMSQVVAEARKAYEVFRQVPAPKRGEVLRQVREALDARKQELGALVSLEMGKILPEGIGEVQEAIDILDFAVGLSRTLNGSVMNSERPEHFLAEVPHPLGVVGLITAFNFPIAVAFWNWALSFAAGNATVWKPAPTTSLIGLAAAKIVQGVLAANNLPGHLFAVACGGTEAGQALVNDPGVELISFTGSEKIGRKVGTAVAGRFGKSILELGGNNAMVVMDDANQTLALRTALFACVGTAGQRCTSTRRLLLHSSIASEFVNKLKQAYAQVKVGHPLDEGILCGPVHSATAVANFEAALQECREQGGEIVAGGSGNVTNLPEELSGGYYVKPTIVFWGNKSAPVMEEEVFAPLVHVRTFDTLEEAIAINNSVRQGLSSALFTSSQANTFKWIGPAGADSGIVNVNTSTSGAEITAPFGGNKHTGWGRESGGEAWKQYCRFSSCAVNYGQDVPLSQGLKFGD